MDIVQQLYIEAEFGAQVIEIRPLETARQAEPAGAESVGPEESP